MVFKGQSSIEYLSTYGWMLIVTSIAAGAIYSYIPEDQCNVEVTSEMSNQLKLESLNVEKDGDLDLRIRNEGAHKATITKIIVNEAGKNTSISNNVAIPKLESHIFTLEGTQKSTSCNSLGVTLKFNSTDLGTVQDSGAIEGKVELP